MHNYNDNIKAITPLEYNYENLKASKLSLDLIGIKPDEEYLNNLLCLINDSKDICKNISLPKNLFLLFSGKYVYENV